MRKKTVLISVFIFAMQRAVSDNPDKPNNQTKQGYQISEKIEEQSRLDNAQDHHERQDKPDHEHDKTEQHHFKRTE